MRLRVLFFHDNHLKTVLITVATLGDSPNNRNSFVEITSVLFCSYKSTVFRAFSKRGDGY